MCWCAPHIHIWWARWEGLGRISRLEKEGSHPPFCRAAVEIPPPPESDEWGRVSSGKSINKLSSPLFFCILFQVQLPVPPPVPVSNDSKPSRSAVVSLANRLCHFWSFWEIHISTRLLSVSLVPRELSWRASQSSLCTHVSPLCARPHVLHYS